MIKKTTKNKDLALRKKIIEFVKTFDPLRVEDNNELYELICALRKVAKQKRVRA